MKYNFFNLFKFGAALACTAILTVGSAAHADNFVGATNADGTPSGGDGTSWEDPLNWEAGVVPLNNGSNILIGAENQVVFDADTFSALLAASNTQNNTEHRILRLLIGDRTSGAFNGSPSLTFDQGEGITVRATNGNSAVIGGRPGKFTTLNILSGITNIEANRVRVGQATNDPDTGEVTGSGTINLMGGSLICARGGLELGNPNGEGDGVLNISGGEFTTRNIANVYGAGVFNVVGSSATLIGIGSEGSIDGQWNQEAGGTLSLGFDAGGVTPILVDEVDGDPSAAGNGAATFAAGAILDPSNLGGFLGNEWVTVLTAEGGITGAPTLSATSVAAGWESRIIGNELQVRFPSNPGGGDGALKGDVDLSGEVNLFDISPFIGILTSPGGFQAEADVDCNGEVNLFDIAPFIEILTGQTSSP